MQPMKESSEVGTLQYARRSSRKFHFHDVGKLRMTIGVDVWSGDKVSAKRALGLGG